MLAALVAAAALYATIGRGGGANEEAVRADLEAAGCTLKSVKALPGDHSVSPGGISGKWNTDPPTNGPHYEQAAIFGIYEDALEPARVIHDLEHGGVFILYGDEVPDSTVQELEAFYDDHKTGTIMAPLARLGDEFALGAWVSRGRGRQGPAREVHGLRRRRRLLVLPSIPVRRPGAVRPEPAAARSLVVGSRRTLVPPGWRNG